MQILTTKLFIPPLRSSLVARSRLIQKLDQGLECGFVLVTAPAGYGKSTLLSTWVKQLKIPAAWYALDEGDNDPVRFLNYFEAALKMIAPSVEDVLGSSLQAASLPDCEMLLTPLVNWFARQNSPLCLVIDDYHLIQNQFIHQLISFLLNHRPPNLLLVIATRADPPLPLARLRARSEIIELRQSDLCFTAQEASDFLNHTMGVKISSEDAGRITARTEGWIAGLQMAALSMQKGYDNSSFINVLTGSHHYIYDYLMAEILEQQTAEIRQFLLYTSIVDQLNAPLCDALLGCDEALSSMRPSSVILEELEHANLFILPLDYQHLWYRYHALFAELLRGYLIQHDSKQMVRLYARASTWFEEQELIPEAIQYAIAAGEWESVLRLISANVFALLEQNELPSLAVQLESVVAEQNQAHPMLLIGRAWLAVYTGRLQEVENLLNSVEAEKDSFGSTPGSQSLRGQIAAIRAFAAWIDAQQNIANQAAREALEYLPAKDYSMRCLSATLLGLSFIEMNARAEAMEQALVYAAKVRFSHITIFAHGCWAYALLLQGKLQDAYTACQEAIRICQTNSVRQPPHTLSYVYATMSLILCEWNELDRSIYFGREAVALAHRWKQADALHFACTSLGEALFAAGDSDGAFGTLRHAWQIAHNTSGWFEEISMLQEIEWHLAQNNLDAVLQHLHQDQYDLDVPNKYFHTSLAPMSIAQIFRSQKKYVKALEMIRSLLDVLEKRNIHYFRVRGLVLQAAVLNEMGDESNSLDSIQKALVLAAPAGYRRSFLIAGASLIPLLNRAKKARVTPEFVNSLMSSFAQTITLQSGSPGSEVGWVESLSERELDVLKLLAQGCSDKKIGETLVIARETVHKHLKNIYGKLDVHSRTEAIANARKLGLL